jgi:tetratricopeptide (TPR) repeat protein
LRGKLGHNFKQLSGVAIIRYLKNPAAATRCQDAAAAHESLEIALGLDPKLAPAWRALGTLELDAGDLSAARAAFEQVAQLRPTWHDGHTGLALVALADGRAGDALRHAAEAVRATPSQLYHRYLYGIALRAAGRVAEAVPHLEAGEGATVAWNELDLAGAPEVGLDTDRVNRADELAAQAKLPEAIALYREALVRRPGDGRLRARLGMVLAASGKAQEGLAELDRALAEAPDHYYLMMGRADVLALAGRVEEARVQLQRAIEVWPQRSEALKQLGQLEVGEERVDEAVVLFRRAYELDPAQPKTSANLAHGLMLLRDARGAANVMEEALPRIEGAPPLDYFALMLQAQTRAGRASEALAATRTVARRFFGDAAKALDK